MLEMMVKEHNIGYIEKEIKRIKVALERNYQQIII